MGALKKVRSYTYYIFKQSLSRRLHTLTHVEHDVAELPGALEHLGEVPRQLVITLKRVAHAIQKWGRGPHMANWPPRTPAVGFRYLASFRVVLQVRHHVFQHLAASAILHVSKGMLAGTTCAIRE